MAKIIRRTKFFRRKKKWEHFKLKMRKTALRCSILTNICMGTHIYDPNITKELTNKVIEIYSKVAPMVESLINQLPL